MSKKQEAHTHLWVGGCHMLQCRECLKWYGAEDDEFGPCNIKHARGDKKYVTFGMQDCDEPEMLRTADKKK